MIQIGEISVDHATVYTPMGPLDRPRTRWMLGAAIPVSESCPTWAVAAAIVLVPCTGFLSLLLLLIKEADSWSSTLRVTDGRTIYDTVVYSRTTAEWEIVRNAVAWAQGPPQMPVPVNPYALPAGP